VARPAAFISSRSTFAIPHPETAKVLRELMKAAGLATPPEGRTLESICIVEVCSPDYDPTDYN
ncbi:MAG TPA: hypothetical protein VE907_17555, partial [Gammaproteobacteria bacterium]|nr:hypothetical protein [Gammaproteobacteria bacterium]